MLAVVRRGEAERVACDAVPVSPPVNVDARVAAFDEGGDGALTPAFDLGTYLACVVPGAQLDDFMRQLAWWYSAVPDGDLFERRAVYDLYAGWIAGCRARGVSGKEIAVATTILERGLEDVERALQVGSGVVVSDPPDVVDTIGGDETAPWDR